MPQDNVYPRDKKALYKAYKNLRKAIIKEQQGNFSISGSSNQVLDHSRVADLNAYIDEQFIRLVQEYDIHSPVDFPGYVKAKLSLRTANSFVVSQKRYWNREGPASDDDTEFSDYINTKRSSKDTYFPEELPYTFLEEIGVDPSKIKNDLDWCIIGYWALGIDNDRQVAKAVKDDQKYKDISINEIIEHCKNLKAQLKSEIKVRYAKKEESLKNMSILSKNKQLDSKYPEREVAEFIAREYFNTVTRGKHKREQLPEYDYLKQELISRGFDDNQRDDEAITYVLNYLKGRINYTGTRTKEIM